jgi:hypothetical protein
MRFLLVCTVAVSVVSFGCQQPTARLNAPPHGVAERTSDLRPTFAHMMDNALMEDMTISDIHFHPHRDELNSLGKERLKRLAWIMNEHGGTIRFNTRTDNESRVERRADNVVIYLSELGVDTTRDVIRVDVPGGRGVDATRAILIKAKSDTLSGTAEGGPSMFQPTTRQPTYRRPSVDAIR